MIFRLDSLSREENYTTASCPQSGRRKDTEKTHTEDTTPTEFSMTISINNYCFCFFFLRIFIIKIISGRRKWGVCRETEFGISLFIFFIRYLQISKTGVYRWKWLQSAKLFTHELHDQKLLQSLSWNISELCSRQTRLNITTLHLR